MNWDFWGTHFVLAFFALCFVTCITGSAIHFAFRVFNRLLRTISVCVRGWPPAHLDADGDWKETAE